MNAIVVSRKYYYSCSFCNSRKDVEQIEHYKDYAQAEKAGWIIDKNEAYCPKCRRLKND